MQVYNTTPFHFPVLDINKELKVRSELHSLDSLWLIWIKEDWVNKDISVFHLITNICLWWSNPKSYSDTCLISIKLLLEVDHLNAIHLIFTAVLYSQGPLLHKHQQITYNYEENKFNCLFNLKKNNTLLNKLILQKSKQKETKISILSIPYKINYSVIKNQSACLM